MGSGPSRHEAERAVREWSWAGAARLPLRDLARTLGGIVASAFSWVGGCCRAVVRAVAPVAFHVGVIVLSASLALSLPILIRGLAKDLLLYWWMLIENEKALLALFEIVVATLLVIFLNAIRSWVRDRRLARAAREAGIVHATFSRGLLARRKNRRLREAQSTGKDIMLIGSTGFRTFARPDGGLHNALRQARQIRILLLNPDSDGARARAKAILDPEITPERFAVQIRESIAFLKQLKAAQKDVRLKLYSDAPFLKVAILGDYAWLQHYHAGLDVAEMPEFVFKDEQTPERLYVVLYQYFLQRWNNPDIPEYDLEQDALVYRDALGNEVTRTPMHWGTRPPEALEPAFTGAGDGVP